MKICQSHFWHGGLYGGYVACRLGYHYFVIPLFAQLFFDTNPRIFSLWLPLLVGTGDFFLLRKLLPTPSLTGGLFLSSNKKAMGYAASAIPSPFICCFSETKSPALPEPERGRMQPQTERREARPRRRADRSVLTGLRREDEPPPAGNRPSEAISGLWRKTAGILSRL